MAECAIIDAFAGWTRAWNDGNVEGYVDAYLDSPTTRYVSGTTILHGKDKIAARCREKGVHGCLLTSDFEISILGTNDAVVFAKFCLVARDDTRHAGVFTVHLTRLTDTSWKIVSDHSSAM
jgi:ketosteroid isomerase-like protein